MKIPMCLVLLLGLSACAGQSSIARALNDCQTGGTSSSNVSLGGVVASLTPSTDGHVHFIATVDPSSDSSATPISAKVDDANDLLKNSHLHASDHLVLLGAVTCSGNTALFVPAQMTLNGVMMPATPSPTPSAKPTK